MPRGKPGTGKYAGKNAYYKLSPALRKKLGKPGEGAFEKLANTAEKKRASGGRPKPKRAKGKPVKAKKAA